MSVSQLFIDPSIHFRLSTSTSQGSYMSSLFQLSRGQEVGCQSVAASTQRVMRWLISTTNVESVVNLTLCIWGGGDTGESQSSMQTWREQQKDCAWHFWFCWDSMYHFHSQQAKNSKKKQVYTDHWISWPLKYLVARKQHNPSMNTEPTFPSGHEYRWEWI